MELISKFDNVLDDITIDEILTTIECNEKEVNAETIKKVYEEILKLRLKDASYMLEKLIESYK